MADFTKAHERVAQYEGGWANDPVDRGGETYAGIARKFHPSWKGWPIVDSVKGKRRGDYIKHPALKSAILDFYRANFWDKMRGDQIHSQRVADLVYDWYVNSGAKGIKEVQEAAGVTADGKIGPQTLAALNRHNEEELMDKLIAARVMFFAEIVSENHTQAKFIKGWMKRALSFL